MQLEILSEKQIKAVYTDEFKKDFVKEELKPWRVMKKLFRDGYLDGFGMFDKGKMIACALLVKKYDRVVLLDYLDVFAPYRHKGVGTEFIRLLKERYKDYSALICEAETDENIESDIIRQSRVRRLEFYYNNGFTPTEFRVNMYGSRMKVLQASVGGGEDYDLYYELASLYFIQYPERHLENGKVRIYKN